MIRRKQARTITGDEYLSTREGIVSCDIEDVLCGDYVYLLDSMDEEDFEYDDTSFDIFREIVCENKVVGFASYMKDDDGLLLMEFYVMPEYRSRGILCEELSSQNNVRIYLPKISLVKALIECGLVAELEDGIAVSEIPLNVSSFDLARNRDGSEFYCHVYDLKGGCVLLLDEPECFNHSMANRSDESRFELEIPSDERLEKARKIVFNHDEKYLKVESEKFMPTIVFV